MTELLPIPERESAHPAPSHGPYDGAFDIVCVGAGAGGLATALFSCWLGNSVLILEKAPEIGGTTRKAAFWYWVPNNRAMQEKGMEDPREDCLRYMARLSRPEHYDPSDAQLGLPAWEYAMFEAIYDNASTATELLKEKGALDYRHCDFVPDYWAEMPEDKAPLGRVLVPADAKETMSDGGLRAVESMSRTAREAGVDIRTGYRVQRVIRNLAGAVAGVEARSACGAARRFHARKAVIFCTGGFTHNVEIRKNFLNVPIVGGCAAQTNEGDFIPIAGSVGAQLRNMNYAWMCPVMLEKALAGDAELIGTFSPSGDSMIYVNKHGRRVANEKLAYNEMAQTFFEWDPAAGEYSNLVLIAIWDRRSQEHCASDEYGRFIVPDGTDDSHVIRGETLGALTDAIAERLARYEAETGGMRLSADFETNLGETVARFNGFAREGKDADFRRGERQVELLFNGPVAESPSAPNPTMYPIDDSGPYYAALLSGGTLDTKGGPKTATTGQVLDDSDSPIPGLYGVGNCVASASARAYWAGGATLGPILTFAYLAANEADREPLKLTN